MNLHGLTARRAKGLGKLTEDDDEEPEGSDRDKSNILRRRPHRTRGDISESASTVSKDGTIIFHHQDEFSSDEESLVNISTNSSNSVGI